jgi:hypothetical protein
VSSTTYTNEEFGDFRAREEEAKETGAAKAALVGRTDPLVTGHKGEGAPQNFSKLREAHGAKKKKTAVLCRTNNIIGIVIVIQT